MVQEINEHTVPIGAALVDHSVGLTTHEVECQRKRFGKNLFQTEHHRHFLLILKEILTEPMVLLLTGACILYFILGESYEGFLMIMAITFVVAISIFQEFRSSVAIKALQQLTEPQVTVLRNGISIIVPIEDIVPNDVVILEEGTKVPADAIVVESNDLTVNESIITGESFPVEKSIYEGNNQLYQGSIINTGKCKAVITATGASTVLGKLGKSVLAPGMPKTLLQHQMSAFIKRFAFFGFTAFFLIWVFNFWQSGNVVESLLFGLTLAMAVIPEEIPVAFSSFMALGAYSMSRLGIISRQPQVIENLGAVTVICLDKTGTITENRMEVSEVFDFNAQSLFSYSNTSDLLHNRVLLYGSLASEFDPFDAMEKAIREAALQCRVHEKVPLTRIVHEYSLGGVPPMMTHVYGTAAQRIIASKGAAERIMRICKLDAETILQCEQVIRQMAKKGYRIIGVASARHDRVELPFEQDDFDWQFEGLIAFQDPPRKNVEQVLRQFADAGIQVKLVTGDYPETAITIASLTGITHNQLHLDGDKVMKMEMAELRNQVKTINVFARMFPEAKMKIIEAIKENGEIVAMTGDGVNDGPALQSANIGIAMGKKGTAIARQAADLVLTDDNLEKVTEAIRQGRKIFNNLKKAIRYIISIHIPIIFTASVPLILGWTYPNIFTPVHIIFLELIMGPTCSVFFEKEPVEENLMQQPPRKRSVGLFTTSEVMISLIQGLVITTGVLTLYYYYMQSCYSVETTRTAVFTSLLISNVLLTFANRSFSEPIYKTIRYRNPLSVFIILLSVAFMTIILTWPFARSIFGLASIQISQLLICIGVSVATVMWFEVYKYIAKGG